MRITFSLAATLIVMVFPTVGGAQTQEAAGTNSSNAQDVQSNSAQTSNQEQLPWRTSSESSNQSRGPNSATTIPANQSNVQRPLNPNGYQTPRLAPPIQAGQIPRLAPPIQAGQIPTRTAGFQIQSNQGQRIPTQLIPTQPTQPIAQLIPNATLPTRAIPATLNSEPQLFPVQPVLQNGIQGGPGQPGFQNQFGPQSNPRNQVIQDPNVRPASAQEQVSSNQPQQDNQATSQTTDNPTENGITRVKKGIDSLPNEAGQVWREYDISPYTYNVTNSTRPQQALIDWILKETGEELWFNEPLGILNANKNELRVYHTPQVQQQVKQIVDRFVYGKGKSKVMGMRLVTINNPSWRSIAYNKMQPIPVQAPGIEGWLITKENAAILINELSRRGDFKQHSGGDVVVHDGQKYNLSSKRPVQFNQSLRWVNSGGLVYAEPVTSQFDEGFSLDFSSLSSLDEKSCEAIIKCEIDQIERLKKVNLTVPTSTGQTQQIELQIPQMVSFNIHERFRWPSDQVLLLSCGVVATPGPQANNPFDISALLNGSRRRADALMFIEYKGPAQNNVGSSLPSTANIPINGRR